VEAVLVDLDVRALVGRARVAPTREIAARSLLAGLAVVLGVLAERVRREAGDEALLSRRQLVVDAELSRLDVWCRSGAAESNEADSDRQSTQRHEQRNGKPFHSTPLLNTFERQDLSRCPPRLEHKPPSLRPKP